MGMILNMGGKSNPEATSLLPHMYLWASNVLSNDLGITLVIPQIIEQTYEKPSL